MNIHQVYLDNNHYDKHLLFGDAFAGSIFWLITKEACKDIVEGNSKNTISCQISKMSLDMPKLMSINRDIIVGLWEAKLPELEMESITNDLLTSGVKLTWGWMGPDSVVTISKWSVYTFFWCCHIYCEGLEKLSDDSKYARLSALLKNKMDELEADNYYTSLVAEHLFQPKEQASLQSFYEAAAAQLENEEDETEDEDEEEEENEDDDAMKRLQEELDECKEQNKELKKQLKDKNKEIAKLKSQLEAATKAAESPVKENNGFTARQWGMFAYFNAEALGVHVGGNDQNIEQKAVKKCLAKMTGLSATSFDGHLVPKDDDAADKKAATQVAEVIKDVFPETSRQIYVVFDD